VNPFKRLSAWLNPPEKRLLQLKPELLDLASDLESVARFAEQEPLTRIAPFFDITSKWHDRGLGDIITAFSVVNDGQYDDIIGKLVTLDHQFIAAGRSPYGWNRTEYGEAVTPEKVFLGNVYGLFTKTAEYWTKQKDSPKGGWGFSNMEHLNPYDVVGNQARLFIRHHASTMAARTRELLLAI
jgi:hypothetical protein